MCPGCRKSACNLRGRSEFYARGVGLHALECSHLVGGYCRTPSPTRFVVLAHVNPLRMRMRINSRRGTVISDALSLAT